jgi:hypothetical protein
VNFGSPKLALFGACVGLALIIGSWGQSYPLHFASPESSIFDSLPTAYWMGIAIVIPSLVLLSRTSRRIQAAACSASIFLVLQKSLDIFYYYPPGSDQQFQQLEQYYVSQGHIVSVFQHAYRWPAFFILSNQFEIVTGLPARTSAHAFVLFVGLFISICVFLMVEAVPSAGTYGGGAALLGFSVLSYYFIDYQFAPQTFALSMIFLLVAIDVRLKSSRRKSLMQLVLFFSVCVTHAFLPVFYVLYRIYRAPKESERRIFDLALPMIYAATLLYYTGYFERIVGLLYVSYLTMWGTSSYAATYHATASQTEDILIQTFSRATVAAMSAIAGLILIRMIRAREFLGKNLAFLGAGVTYLLLGIPLNILGLRALQILAASASVPIGRFGAMKRKLGLVILVVLAVSSISLQMHSTFNEYQFMDPVTVQHTDFVASHLPDRPPSILVEQMTSGIVQFSSLAKGWTPVQSGPATERTQLRSAAREFFMMTPGILHDLHYHVFGSSIPYTPFNSQVNNRVTDDSRDTLLSAVG